jgi:acetyl esterase
MQGRIARHGVVCVESHFTLSLNPLPPPRLTRAMQDVLSRMARARRPPLVTVPPTAARVAYELGADVLEIAKPALASSEDLSIAVRDGQEIRARLYRPLAAAAPGKLPALVYFHGGGFVIGNLATHDILCRQLCALAGCAVVAVDYRLAPEHKFPVAAHDAWDALCWLHARAAGLNIDADRLAVGGDSAGGTLAAVCAILARDARLPLALQLLFYPGCAAHQDTASHRRFANGFVIDEEQISWFFNHYIRAPADRDDWRFAPLLALDVDGVAPAWIGLAEIDPLVDEGVLYADKLRAAGISVDLEIYRGVTHEFIKMGRVIPEARQAHADAAGALRRAFGIPV